jgi:phosphatidylglycerophosphate synthase
VTVALIIAGGAWCVGTAVWALSARRPGIVLDETAARRAWQEGHGLQKPLQETSHLVSSYVTATHALARPLARIGVDPDAITLGSIGPALASAGLIGLGYGWAIAGGALAIATGLLDGLDGALAILSERTSDFGFVLDSVVDRVIDLILLAGPYLARRDHATLGTAIGAGAAIMLMEYTRARMQVRDPVVARITPGERPTRVLLLGLGGIGAGTLDLVLRPVPRWFWPTGLGALTGLCTVSTGLLLADFRRSSSRRPA